MGNKNTKEDLFRPKKITLIMSERISTLSDLKGIPSTRKVKVFRKGMILIMTAKEAREYLRELRG